MNAPFAEFTVSSPHEYWNYFLTQLVQKAFDRTGHQYQIGVPINDQFISDVCTLYPKDGGTETFQAFIEPNEERPTSLYICWKNGDSQKMKNWMRQHADEDEMPSVAIPLRRVPRPEPKPVAVPQPKPVAKPVAKVAPKRDVHPPRYYSPGVPQPRPKAVTVPQPKPGAKQPAANPHRVRVPVHDDDDDDSDDVREQRRFDPGHPLQHPRDDDVPLDFLKNKSYSYIQDTIGIRGIALAKVIKEHGTSINRSREIRRNMDYDKRRQRQDDREIERRMNQIERQLAANEQNDHRVRQNFAELRDLLGYGHEQ